MNLSQHFKGVVVKRLSKVEANLNASNQHEFNGVTGLRNMLGRARRQIPARLFWFGTNGTDQDTTMVTWYDAREFHKTRTEHRMYFPTNKVMNHASEGDLLIVANRPGGQLFVVVVEAGTTLATELPWVFQPASMAGEVNKDPELEAAMRLISEGLK